MSWLVLIALLACFMIFQPPNVSAHCEQYVLSNYCRTVLEADRKPRTCLDLLCRGYSHNGVYDVYPLGGAYYSFPVYCDQTTDGGGWTVFQVRMDGSVDFYRNWANYKRGFGEVNGEHWLGLDNIRSLLQVHTVNELRVDMEYVDNERTYATYERFSIGPESDNYRLSVTNFTRTSIAGDALQAHSGQQFSTKDRDNDSWEYNCAVSYKGAWWYHRCHSSNLNGLYLNGAHESYANGVNWNGHYESLKTTEMKFRAHL